MKLSSNTVRLLTLFGSMLASAGIAQAQTKFVAITGAQCSAPPVLHCPDSGCSGPTMINEGPFVEMKTRRQYFLDYPCDLKPGEKVTLVMSLHGGGSYGNWHRNYFPLMDYTGKYRLVVITPNTPTRQWDMEGADDPYLQNLVNFVLEELGKNNVQTKAFWLAGHSWGGLTSNRLLRTQFFKDRVDGFLSLSGGRIGGQPGGGPTGATAARPPGGAAPAAAAAPAAGARPPGPGPAGNASAFALMSSLPDTDFSFIYETGRREMSDQGFPAASELAKKYGCGEKARRTDIVDTKAGYVFDGSRLATMNPSWGLVPGPGTAEVYEYPKCKDGRIVYDVARLNKGHTEGLEPNVTESLIKLMLSAKGNKLQQK